MGESPTCPPGACAHSCTQVFVVLLIKGLLANNDDSSFMLLGLRFKFPVLNPSLSIHFFPIPALTHLKSCY